MNVTNIDFDEHNPDTLKIIYLLYLAAIFFGLTAFIGIVLVYINKSRSEDWLRTHYIYLEHTFWKGFVFALFGAILKIILIGYLLWAFLAVWWIVRCVKGVQTLARREAIADPYSWYF